VPLPLFLPDEQPVTSEENPSGEREKFWWYTPNREHRTPSMVTCWN